MTLIGIAGSKRSGKTTVAQRLVDAHGFGLVALADPVKEAIAVLNPWVPDPHPGSDRFVPLTVALEYVRGDEDALKSIPVTGDEVRRLWQRFGTEVGRGMFGQGVWLALANDLLDEHYPKWWAPNGPDIVIPDIRFDNEAEWVRRFNGRVIHVSRALMPQWRPDSHSSEQGIHPHLVDHSIVNAGSVSELHGQVDDILKGIYANV
jgi:hypothetical protein